MGFKIEGLKGTFEKTPQGQLLYDLAFVERTDKWLARKHQLPIAEVRNLRKSPILDKLRKQVLRDRGAR